MKKQYTQPVVFFNTVGETHNHRHDHVVHEHRAPTDASVRLLNEMQEKAKENIIASLQLSKNALGSQLIVAQEAMTGAYIFNVVFDINGDRIVCHHKTPNFTKIEDNSTWLPGLLEAIKTTIAESLLFEALIKGIKDPDTARMLRGR